MSSGKHKKNSRANSVILAIVLVLVIIVAAGIFLVAKIQNVKDAPIPAPTEEPAATPAVPTPEPTLSPEELKKLEEAALAEAAAKDAEAAKYSFYQKLENGYGTDILILGDSTAADADFSALSEHLQSKYLSASGSAVNVANLANADGNLLCDVLRVNEMPDKPDYDLAILCYGQNDSGNDVTQNFESLIVALKSRFPDCSIICTIEPGFHAITTELQAMTDVCSAHHVPVINLFSEFYDKGSDSYFDYFDSSQTSLGEKGIDEWNTLLCALIDENVAQSTGKMDDRPLISRKSEEMAKLRFIPIDDVRVSRTDDTSYSLDFKAKGASYILHKQDVGGSDVKVIADDILYQFGKPCGVKTPDGSYIIPIHEELSCERDFTITFSSKELADGLEGFYLIESSD